MFGFSSTYFVASWQRIFIALSDLKTFGLRQVLSGFLTLLERVMRSKQWSENHSGEGRVSIFITEPSSSSLNMIQSINDS